MTPNESSDLAHGEGWRKLNGYERAYLQLTEADACMPPALYRDAVELAVSRFVREEELSNKAALLREFRARRPVEFAAAQQRFTRRTGLSPVAAALLGRQPYQR